MELAIGQEIKIGGKKFRVMSIAPDAESVFFAKVLKSGKLAKPGPGAMGSYTYAEIEKYVEIGAFSI